MMPCHGLFSLTSRYGCLAALRGTVCARNMLNMFFFRSAERCICSEDVIDVVRSSRTFLWMVKVLREFRRRRISPATRQRRAAVQRTSSARQADAVFPE
eukprot:11134643-Heterocapsa_arctica.AAC.1